MITVEEARALLMGAVRLTATSTLDLLRAHGHRSADMVRSPHDHPLFDMSAVDGYAFAFDPDRTSWTVVAEIAAGEVLPQVLAPGECARIFTGAMVPAGADTVVMQEFVAREGARITHSDGKLSRGGNVRRKGEQLRTGDRLLEVGTRLGAAEIGLLASAGITALRVHRKPTVSLVRTGGEFTSTTAPEPGRIFSSNELMLAAALQDEGIATEGRVFTPRDDKPELLRDLQMALDRSDLVITTGGVSVGDHDLVRACLEDLGAEVLFHGVRQKPGKPMLAARCGNTLVLALPGNPRAVLVGWHLFVRPVIQAMQGAVDPWPRYEALPLAQGVRWKGGRTEFRAGRVEKDRVHLLADEGSHMLLGLTHADALVELPAEGGTLDAGKEVTVHHLQRP
ncbi:MAG TPA: molybdopterin molybdotransferase MoeA [Flavobacteriales bacterium]|nr:molybdopterin molybdotransferase MoeA [Flavobacteriales bacterium]